MSTDTHVLDVIEAIYGAAMDENQWSDALKKLTALTDSQAATFWVLDSSEKPRLPVFTYINLDPTFIADYQDHMVPHDPTIQYLVNHPRQPIVHDGLVITEREKDHHLYYDWHHRYSDLRFRLVSQMRPAQSIQAGIALHRTRKIGRYEPGDIERFTILHRHIKQALAIGFRLGSLRTMQQCTTKLLDRNPAAILFMDEHRHIVYANQGAERFRSGSDSVLLSVDGVALLRKPDNDRLQSLIAQALASTMSPGASPGGAMSIQRPSGKRPYTILVTPISRQNLVMSTLRPAVCIVITDPDGQRPLPIDLLQGAFGLTEAEARLAALLATGEELRSAAATLRISYGTTRTRLADIFQKTGTHSQGDLIRLLLTALAII